MTKGTDDVLKVMEQFARSGSTEDVVRVLASGCPDLDSLWRFFRKAVRVATEAFRPPRSVILHGCEEHDVESMAAAVAAVALVQGRKVSFRVVGPRGEHDYHVYAIVDGKAFDVLFADEVGHEAMPKDYPRRDYEVTS